MKQVSSTEIQEKVKKLESDFASKKAEWETLGKQIESAKQAQTTAYGELVRIQGAYNALQELLPKDEPTPVVEPDRLKTVKEVSAPKTVKSK